MNQSHYPCHTDRQGPAPRATEYTTWQREKGGVPCEPFLHVIRA